MISSVSGTNGNPLLSPYCTSKHAIEGLSESLRREFMRFGIDVIVVAPGAVKTPIWDMADEIDMTAYGSSPFLPALERIRAYMLKLAETGLPAEKIGEVVHEALTLPRPKVRYEISPEPFRMLMMRTLPKRMLDRMVAKRLVLMPHT
jgi:NAD(P)-dependent dehydrogenase (short-subunit alcohol dehydrogenase family)